VEQVTVVQVFSLVGHSVLLKKPRPKAGKFLTKEYHHSAQAFEPVELAGQR